MDMSGRITIAATRDKVWAALNDEEILQSAIPGCDEIVRVDDTHFTAKVRQKIGPISTKFSGKIELTDLDPPNGYRISGTGDGGSVGFAKGGATVSLSDDPAGGTVLSYEVQAQVGGKIAQLGGRLIDSTAKKLADQFFVAFKRVLEEPVTDATTDTIAPAQSDAQSVPTSAPQRDSVPADAGRIFGLPRQVVVIAGVAIMALIVWYFSTMTG